MGGGGEVRGRWDRRWGQVGSQRRVLLYIEMEKAAIMFSLKYREGHSVLVRPRWSLAAVIHQM